MAPADIVDLGRNAMILTLMLSAPVLGVGLVVGLLVGLLQALTQIQEQTVAFVPKIVAMLVTLAVALPWLITQMTDYFVDLMKAIPGNL